MSVVGGPCGIRPGGQLQAACWCKGLSGSERDELLVGPCGNVFTQDRSTVRLLPDGSGLLLPRAREVRLRDSTGP